MVRSFYSFLPADDGCRLMFTSLEVFREVNRHREQLCRELRRGPQPAWHSNEWYRQRGIDPLHRPWGVPLNPRVVEFRNDRVVEVPEVPAVTVQQVEERRNPGVLLPSPRG